MSIITLLVLSVGLAMDAFAVSIANGISIKEIKISLAFKIAFFFGLFQAVMPLIGCVLGKSFSHFMSDYSHWIVFLILFLVGAKMIYEAVKPQDENSVVIKQMNNRVLICLAVATSIDALAVGISLSFMQVGILFPVLVIGVVTFIISFVGIYIGKRLGTIFGRRMEILGGVILVLLGIKFLITLN